MRAALPLLPRPSHFSGAEHGTARKDPATVKARLALAFPDLYEIGMSYTGMAILYHAVNQHPGFQAERVFAPSEEAAAILRDQGFFLSTLESDTTLKDVDVLGFHLTHELCFTNVLYMLELGGMALRSQDRDLDNRDWTSPLVLAGGGVALNAEPLVPFLDCLVLGDGEEVLCEVMAEVARAKEERLSKRDLLAKLTELPGIYVPGMDQETVERRVIEDLDTAPYPTNPVQPFGAVHDRYTLEIARGCTRGCRFCHAGMVYRPARERSLAGLDTLLGQGLDTSGHSEISFLSLSAGDFSALAGLFTQSLEKCRAEQVSVSLPSLRAGSVNEDILRAMAGLRRTGATIAPEAGTDRLRAVINKGITEEELLDHTRTLFSHGWQHVKLYFMIGLPTETEEDLLVIPQLCLKVLDTGRNEAGKLPGRLQVTAAISPFVPKPHTPFQWERQLSQQETRERIFLLKDQFSRHKRLTMRWHEPEASFLEGVFSRGDRKLAEVVERAFHKGALFTSWTDTLRLDLWLEAMAECGVNPDEYLAARDLDSPLPWDHINIGVDKKFLLRERTKALKGAATEDCRYGACSGCGVCTHMGFTSRLTAQAHKDIQPRLNQAARDQEVSQPESDVPVPSEAPPPPPPGRKPAPPKLREELTRKAAHIRLWYAKQGPAAFVSQLELQALFERAMRRAKLPLPFSQGHHPMPLVSFCRALPVGVS
ncbi:MAG: TIGR03960 family B12-binding radical SAM protein, partial [Desulfovibrio sp.]